MTLTIDYLKDNHSHIHAFGLGFIQIKIDATHRFHFYVPEVTITGGDLEVHNHRYDFVSRVLRGSLTNIIYRFTPNEIDGKFESRLTTCGHDTKDLQDCSRTKGDLCITSEHTLHSGSYYSMKKDTLHRVETNRAITYLVRDLPPFRPYADVIYPIGHAEECPFSANMPVSDLWNLVERELTDANFV